MKTNKLFFCAAVFALTPLLLFAQIDEKAMQSDISILEEVLNTLLSPAGSRHQLSSHGLYLPGYGVIFSVNYNRTEHFSFPENFHLDMKRVQESQVKLQQALARINEDKAKMKEPQEKFGKELEKSGKELARAEDKIAQVEVELQKMVETATERDVAVVVEQELHRATREARGVAALHEAQADSSSVQKAREIMANLKKNLARFYSDYAQGLRQLPATERITIVVNFDARSGFAGWPGRAGKSELMDFSVSLPKSDLPALRKSRTPESLLQFQDAHVNESVNRELDIFTGILSKAVGEKPGKAPWAGSGARSMYVPGYGAIIMLSSSSFIFAGMDALKVYAEKAATGEKRVSSRESIPSPEENWKNKMPVAKEQIIDQIARFGGSLHGLKSSENIMVVLSSQRGFWGDDRTPGLSIAARMSDVSKVFHEEISLQAFKNALAIREY